MKRAALILILILALKNVDAQQLPMYSQYLNNKFLINPAVAGSDGYTSFGLTARQQWIGYSGAPRTYSLSVEGRVLKKGFSLGKNGYKPGNDGKVGLGGYIFSDRNGLIDRTGFQAAYSYHIWLNGTTQMSMGISFNGYYYKIDESQVHFEDPDDPMLLADLRRGIFVPDFTFGMYFLSPDYNLGISADQVLEAAARIGSDGYKNLKMTRHYFMFGSYDFGTSSGITIRPEFLATFTETPSITVDLGAIAIWKNDFWAGLSYRTSGAIIASTGIKYNNLYIGYSVDFALSEIQRLTYGSHELSLAMKFGDTKRRYRWIDRF